METNKQIIFCESSPPWQITVFWHSFWHTIWKSINIYILLNIYIHIYMWQKYPDILSRSLSLSGVTDILSNILSGICSDILSDIFFCQSIWIYLVSILAWYSFWPSIWHLFWHSIWHLFRHSIWHIFWHSLWHSLWHVFRSRRVPLHGSGPSVLHCIRSRHAPQHPGLAISPGVLHSIQSCVYYRSSGHWPPSHNELAEGEGREEAEMRTKRKSRRKKKKEEEEEKKGGEIAPLWKSRNPYLPGGEKQTALSRKRTEGKQ